MVKDNRRPPSGAGLVKKISTFTVLPSSTNGVSDVANQINPVSSTGSLIIVGVLSLDGNPTVRSSGLLSGVLSLDGSSSPGLLTIKSSKSSSRSVSSCVFPSPNSQPLGKAQSFNWRVMVSSGSDCALLRLIKFTVNSTTPSGIITIRG